MRDIGVAGQQQQPRRVSAEAALRGGAGGFFISRGGATKPASPVPSPEIKVPVQSVAASAAVITFLVVADFIFCKSTSDGYSDPSVRAQLGKDLLCIKRKAIS